MSSRINLNEMLIEAQPFWRERPFINPDKALVKYELPLKKNFMDRFHQSSTITENEKPLSPSIDYRT